MPQVLICRRKEASGRQVQCHEVCKYVHKSSTFARFCLLLLIFFSSQSTMHWQRQTCLFKCVILLYRFLLLASSFFSSKPNCSIASSSCLFVVSSIKHCQLPVFLSQLNISVARFDCYYCLHHHLPSCTSAFTRWLNFDLHRHTHRHWPRANSILLCALRVFFLIITKSGNVPIDWFPPLFHAALPTGAHTHQSPFDFGSMRPPSKSEQSRADTVTLSEWGVLAFIHSYTAHLPDNWHTSPLTAHSGTCTRACTLAVYHVFSAVLMKT